MRIAKKETVYLSQNEMEAFFEVIRIMEGIERTADSPFIQAKSETISRRIKEFLAEECEVEEIEEEEESVFSSNRLQF